MSIHRTKEYPFIDSLPNCGLMDMQYFCLPASSFTPCAEEWKSYGITCCTSHCVKAGEEIKDRETRADWPGKVNLDTVWTCLCVSSLGLSALALGSLMLLWLTDRNVAQMLK